MHCMFLLIFDSKFTDCGNNMKVYNMSELFNEIIPDVSWENSRIK